MKFSIVEFLRLLVLLASGFLAGSTVTTFLFFRRMSRQHKNKELPLRSVLFLAAFLLLVLSEMAEQFVRFVANVPMTFHLPVLLVVVPTLATSLRLYVIHYDEDHP